MLPPRGVDTINGFLAANESPDRAGGSNHCVSASGFGGGETTTGAAITERF